MLIGWHMAQQLAAHGVLLQRAGVAGGHAVVDAGMGGDMVEVDGAADGVAPEVAVLVHEHQVFGGAAQRRRQVAVGVARQARQAAVFACLVDLLGSAGDAQRARTLGIVFAHAFAETLRCRHQAGVAAFHEHVAQVAGVAPACRGHAQLGKAAAEARHACNAGLAEAARQRAGILQRLAGGGAAQTVPDAGAEHAGKSARHRAAQHLA